MRQPSAYALLTPLVLWALFAALGTQAQEVPLTVLVFHRPPYYVVEDGSRFSGFLVDYTRKVMHAANIPFVFEEAPPQRIIKTMEDGERLACAVGWFRTTQREAFASFSNPIYMDRPTGVAMRTAVRDKLPKILTADALLSSGLRLGLRHGFSYGEQLDAKVAAHQMPVDRSVAENDQLLEMIARSRIDYTFISPEEYDWLTTATPGLRRDIRFFPLGDSTSENSRHIMCSKSIAPERIARINSAIQSLGPATR
jgi:polar amino acid transport system substrate-binding protein